MDNHARMCKAVHAERVPATVADIARRIADYPTLSKKTLIVGTNALYAYEAAASVFIEQDIVATDDVDILWDTRHKISIASTEPKGFIGLLKSVDKSFDTMKGSRYRAYNKEGFIVDLIQPSSKDVMIDEIAQMSEFPDDLIAVDIKGLDWLVSCPKFTATAIDDNGYPVELTVPDPRAFSIHKYWLSNQPDRERNKVARDLEQSRVVFDLLREKMPYLDFSDKALNALPGEIRRKFKAA